MWFSQWRKKRILNSSWATLVTLVLVLPIFTIPDTLPVTIWKEVWQVTNRCQQVSHLKFSFDPGNGTADLWTLIQYFPNAFALHQYFDEMIFFSKICFWLNFSEGFNVQKLWLGLVQGNHEGFNEKRILNPGSDQNYILLVNFNVPSGIFFFF